MKKPLPFRGVVGLLSVAQMLGAVPRRRHRLLGFDAPSKRTGLEALFDSPNIPDDRAAYPRDPAA